jgi:hypothetical protein
VVEAVTLGGRRARGGAVIVVVPVVREAAVPSSPRWRCWSPIAVVAVVAVVVLEARCWWRTELADVVALVVVVEAVTARWSPSSRWWWSSSRWR